jgi:hypothetical protein
VYVFDSAWAGGTIPSRPRRARLAAMDKARMSSPWCDVVV